MPRFDKHLTEMRAESLAIVYLTRRDDLAIKHQANDSQIDLLVSLLENGRVTGRCFGVEVKGVVSEQDIHRSEINRTLMLSHRNQERYNDIPICLFLFVMLGDQGYWRWLKQPVFNGQQRELSTNTDAALRPLDNTEPQETKALSEIIDAVNAWYDERPALVAA